MQFMPACCIRGREHAMPMSPEISPDFAEELQESLTNPGPTKPIDEVIAILARPVKCGYVDCGMVFGRPPTPADIIDPETGFNPMQAFEARLAFHQQLAGHKQRKLAWD